MFCLQENISGKYDFKEIRFSKKNIDAAPLKLSYNTIKENTEADCIVSLMIP